MRYLAWFTLGFCGLCTLWAYLPLWSVAAVLGLLVLFLLVFWKKNKFRRIFLTVLIGILAGSLWFSIYQLGLRDVQALDGRTAAGTVTFLEDSRATASGQSVRCRLEAEEGCATVRLFLYSGEKLKAGTTYSGRFRLRRDETGNYAGRGEFLTASPVGGLTEGPAAEVPLHTRLRSTILDLLDEVFPSNTAPLARGLLLGDTMDVPDSLNVALKRTGVRHVVAVSGLHVSILCALLLILCGRRKNLAIFLCLPVMLLFVLMAGNTPSAIRAAIMASLMLLAGVVHREYDPPTALGGELCLLRHSPERSSGGNLAAAGENRRFSDQPASALFHRPGPAAFGLPAGGGVHPEPAHCLVAGRFRAAPAGISMAQTATHGLRRGLRSGLGHCRCF